MAEYAPKRCRENTQSNYRGLFDNHIKPRWGTEFVQNVKPMAVEDWLETYPRSRQVKSHVRNLMHTLYQAAIRWEIVDRNPVDLVRQTQKRLKTPRILTPAEFKALLETLVEPYKEMVITIACLGLRVSELVGLRWGDIDFRKPHDQNTAELCPGSDLSTKTEASEGTLPLDTDLAEMLLAHRTLSPYSGRFGLCLCGGLGKGPLAGKYAPRPYQARSGRRPEIGNIGWHSFRHSLFNPTPCAGHEPRPCRRSCYATRTSKPP